jgi:DNA gyrase subunit B
MPELVDQGYVYLAKAPLYRAKQGSTELFIETDSELEDFLLRDKLEKIEVRDRGGTQFKLTDARWQRFVRQLKPYQGWASALRAKFGHDAVRLVMESELLDAGVTDDREAVALLQAETTEGEAFETSVLGEDPAEIVVRQVERKTGAAATVRLRREMFSNPEYRSLVGVHRELSKLGGTAPFSVAFRKREEEALSFEELRAAVLDVAKEGVDVQRFKGLGEMNPDQLFDTTMDPGKRTLRQVTIEDAAVADEIFSMLMGDKVEPRREFIEKYARDVENLDV